MYCRKCKYDLHGVPSAVCPECGRAFDPDDPRTWEPVPPEPATSLAILVAGFVTLILGQLLLFVLRPLLPPWLAGVDWLLSVLAPAAAFASGWYAEHRPALLVYGGLCIFIVVPAFHAHGFAEAYLANVAPLLQAGVWIGLAMVLMFGCWLTGRFAWSLHGRIERRQRELAARGESARRRWPRPRTVVLLVVLTVVATAGWMTLETVAHMSGRATARVNHRAVIDHLRLDVTGDDWDDATAAWDAFEAKLGEVRDVYREVARSLVRDGFEPREPEDRGEISFRRVRRGDRVPADVQREQRAIDALRRADLFAAVAGLADAPVPLGRPGAGLWPAGLVVEARLASMRLAAEAGRYDEVAQAFEEVMTLARVSSFQGGSRAHRLGGHYAGLAADELCHELLEHEMPEAVCARLLRTVETRTLAPPTLAVACDRELIRDDLQQHFTDDGADRGHLVPRLGPTASWRARFLDAFRCRFVLAPRHEESERCEAIMDAALADLARPLDERRIEPVDEVMPALTERYEVVPRAVRRASGFLEAEAMQRRGLERARLAVAVALFRSRHGRLPATLDELVPEILDELPFDPVSGGSFRYARTGADPPAPPFVISGVGSGGVEEPLTGRRHDLP